MTPYQDDIHLAAQASLPWSRFKHCKILIAGASGLIGSCLTEILLESASVNDLDLHIYAMGRDEQKTRARFAEYNCLPYFHILEQDVTQPLESTSCFDYIIHAASSASPQLYQNKPVEVMKANFIGVSNLLEYGIAHKMKRFLYLSSGEVYGDQQAEKLHETLYGNVDILNPRSCYPSSKRAAETLAICYAREYGADIVIARPCHTFGPYFQDSDQRAYAQFIRNAEAGKDLILKSDGSHYRSWCYVVDCATALLTILLKGHSGQAYNIADKNCETSMRILAETIARLGNVSLQVGQPDASSGQRVVFDTTLLEELGWKTEGTLADKLTHTLSTRKMKADEKEH